MSKDPVVEDSCKEFTIQLNNLLGRDASVPFRPEIQLLIDEAAKIRACAGYSGSSNDGGAWCTLVEGAFKFYYNEWFGG